MTRRTKILLTIFTILLAATIGIWLALPSLKTLVEPDWRDPNLPTQIEVTLTDEQRTAAQKRVTEKEVEIAAQITGGEPDLMVQYLLLGIFHESLGELGAARDAYLTAAEIRPTSSTPWGNLGSLYQTMGSPTLAEAALKRAVYLNPADHLAWDKLTDLSEYILTFSVSQMKHLYEKGLAAAPGDVNLKRKYATYLERAGELRAAHDVWKEISEDNPTDYSAYEAYTRIETLLGTEATQ